jgi:hypothetical protein
MMRLSKLICITMILFGCTEDTVLLDRPVLVPAGDLVPRGICAWSMDLSCWACFYKYQMRDAVICQERP